MDAAAVADDLAIRRIIAEYCHRVDDARFDDLAELFTVDGRFRFRGEDATGRDELRSWFAGKQPPEHRGKHLTTNSVIDVEGDRAEALSDFVFLAFAGGRLVPAMTGRYRDELHRIDGRWFIHRRDAVLLLPASGDR